MRFYMILQLYLKELIFKNLFHKKNKNNSNEEKYFVIM